MKIRINGKDAKHSKGIFGNNIVITGNNNVVVNGESICNLNNLPGKEIKIEIIKDNPYIFGDKYVLYFNSVAMDWFILSNNEVVYDLDSRLRKILNITVGDYEAYQELIKKYLKEVH